MITYNTSDAEQLPLFVRSGAIIPMRKDQNWIEPGETWDPLTLDFYPDSASAFILYEDDKRTTYYQNGEFSSNAISCLQDSSKIEIRIGEASGDYKGKPESRKIVLKVNLISSAPSIVILNSGKLKKTDSKEAPDNEQPNWYYDKDKKLVVVTARIKSSKETQIVISK
jgi:alpha-glucosidase